MIAIYRFISKFFLFFLLFFVTASSFSQQIFQEDDSEIVSVILLKNRLYANRVLKLIRSSKVSIKLCLSTCDYISNDRNDIATRLLEEIVNQAKRGIDVEVILERNKEKGKEKKNTPAKNYLYQNGIKVYDDPDNIITNCNMLIVDSFTCVAGTTVWTSNSINKNDELEFWIESMEVAQMLLDRFNEIKASGQE